MCGFAPYGQRARELLKVSKDQRALKFIQKRVRIHTCAKRTRKEPSNLLAATRKAALKKDWAHALCVIKPVQGWGGGNPRKKSPA